MGKICVIGSLNMDLSIVTQRMPRAGETVSGHDFQMLPGGKGLNQAIAASRLGGEVRLIGAVGADAFGKALQGFIAREQIDQRGISSVSTAATGTATIIIEHGDNRIIIYPGANETITAAIIETHAELITTSDVVVAQLEIPLPSIVHALILAKAAGKLTIFNPAPMQTIPAELLEQVDILVVNESECQQLTQITVRNAEDAKLALAKLQVLKVQQAIITLGERGVYFTNGARVEYRPAMKVAAIDTTGAGDTFVGALASALSRGEQFEQAIEFAIAASALAVTRRGAATAIPTLAEVVAFCQEQIESRE